MTVMKIGTGEADWREWNYTRVSRNRVIIRKLFTPYSCTRSTPFAALLFCEEYLKIGFRGYTGPR